MAFVVRGRLDLLPTIASFGYAFFGVLFILFINDWADQDVDALRRRVLPQSSPKTIADGVLPAATVLRFGLLSLTLSLASAVWAGGLREQWSVTLLGVFGTALFSVYSLPPFRINDRGGGELLEALGVALVLPVFALHAQLSSAALRTALAQPWCWGFLLGFFLLALAAAIASGLGDEHSDRLGGKRTWVVLVGNRKARRSIELLVALTAALWLTLGITMQWTLAFGGVVALMAVVLLVRRSEGAARHDAPNLATYKDALRSALGRSIAVYCLALLFGPVIQS